MKRRHSTLLIAALAMVALVALACSKTATNTNNANTSTNTSNTKTTSTTTTPTSTSGSPITVMQASFDAAKKKDIAGFKKTVSAADLKKLDDVAKESGKTVDDFLKDIMESPESTMPASLETRNEKINGDKATIEYKDKDGEWKTAHFIKEGGEWKMKMGGDSEESATDKKESGEMDDHDTGHR